MHPRMDYMKIARGVYEAMMGIEKYLAQSSIDENLRNLVKVRASQINQCAYCIDMHWKNARAQGETEQRLYGLGAWQESPYYSDRERAALLWTEMVTNIKDTQAPDSAYQILRAHFSEKEAADLTFTIAAINTWNRLAISARAPAGTYQPPNLGERKTA